MRKEKKLTEREMIDKINSLIIKKKNTEYLWEEKTQTRDRKYRNYVRDYNRNELKKSIEKNVKPEMVKNTTGNWGEMKGKFTTKTNFQYNREQSGKFVGIEYENGEATGLRYLDEVRGEGKEYIEDRWKKKLEFKCEKPVIIYDKNEAQIMRAELWENGYGNKKLKIRVGKKKVQVEACEEIFEKKELNEKIKCNGIEIEKRELLRLAIMNGTEIYRVAIK